MKTKRPLFMSELPAAPDFNPVQKAIERTTDSDISAALRLFASMPASTGILANPVRYRHAVDCAGTPLDLNIRSFAIRGCLFEEDIAAGAADAMRTIFVGLFGRFSTAAERQSFVRLLSGAFKAAREKVLPGLAAFMKLFPAATADVAMQNMASLRKATGRNFAVNTLRPSADLLRDLIDVHLENAAVAACSSYMRSLLNLRPRTSAGVLARKTRQLCGAVSDSSPFQTIFSLLLRRSVSPVELRILENMGTIQIHHGSAGSSMVARYFASLHTRSVSDLFTASQMALDCARHFGAISELSEFVAQLETIPAIRRDEVIRQRAIAGNLPAFGHPEIAAAGRGGAIELDPRPALYLAPLFEAIDSGKIQLTETMRDRLRILQRVYQLAVVEGIEKTGHRTRLRILPNTDFGAWIVQEALGIEEVDRTLLSYVFRGFGWMMDVREQLQQPIIRPVIPAAPDIVPLHAADGLIPRIVDAVHTRLCSADAFAANEGQ